MLNNNNETERNLITNGTVSEETMIENGVLHEHIEESNFIKFNHINPESQEHILTISTNGIITLCVDSECIILISEHSHFNGGGKNFEDIRIAKRTKKGCIFRIRVIYKDALQMLKKLGYKKDTEHIRVSKEDNTVCGHYVSEKWVNEKHNVIFDCLISTINISKSNE